MSLNRTSVGEYRIEVLNNLLVVEKDTIPSTTPDGIQLPESFRNRPVCTGTVLASGLDQSQDPTALPPFKPGDRIAFPDYAGTTLRLSPPTSPNKMTPVFLLEPDEVLFKLLDEPA